MRCCCIVDFVIAKLPPVLATTEVKLSAEGVRLDLQICVCNGKRVFFGGKTLQPQF